MIRNTSACSVIFSILCLATFNVCAETYSFGSWTNSGVKEYMDPDGSFVLSWAGTSGGSYESPYHPKGYHLTTNNTTTVKLSPLSSSYSYSQLPPGTYAFKLRYCWWEEDWYEEYEQCNHYRTTITVTVPNPSPGAYSFTYEYDEYGRLIKAVDNNGQSTGYEYDAADNRLEKKVQ